MPSPKYSLRQADAQASQRQFQIRACSPPSAAPGWSNRARRSPPSRSAAARGPPRCARSARPGRARRRRRSCRSATPGRRWACSPQTPLKRGRLADRAAGVGAGRGRRQARRDRRGRAARGAARDAARGPRDCAPGRSTRSRWTSPWRTRPCCVLPSSTAPARVELLDHVRVVGADEVRQHPRAAGGAQALGAEDVLVRDRDAGRAGRASPRRAPLVGRAGLREARLLVRP